VTSSEHGGSGARTVQTGAGAAVAAPATAAAAAWGTRVQWSATPTGDEDVQGLRGSLLL